MITEMVVGESGQVRKGKFICLATLSVVLSRGKNESQWEGEIETETKSSLFDKLTSQDVEKENRYFRCKKILQWTLKFLGRVLDAQASVQKNVCRSLGAKKQNAASLWPIPLAGAPSAFRGPEGSSTTIRS